MLKKSIKFFSIALLIILAGLLTRYLIATRLLVKDDNQASTQALFASQLQDSKGVSQALEQWRGKIIVLNFWATWCPPCREEMPELSALNNQYQDKNLIVLGLAIDNLEAVKAYVQEAPVSYHLLIAEDSGMDLASGLGNNKGVLPFTLIIKPDGTIAKTFFGRISAPLLTKTLQTLF